MRCSSRTIRSSWARRRSRRSSRSDSGSGSGARRSGPPRNRARAPPRRGSDPPIARTGAGEVLRDVGTPSPVAPEPHASLRPETRGTHANDQQAVGGLHPAAWIDHIARVAPERGVRDSARGSPSRSLPSSGPRGSLGPGGPPCPGRRHRPRTAPHACRRRSNRHGSGCRERGSGGRRRRSRWHQSRTCS
jgi:hypothetical protein